MKKELNSYIYIYTYVQEISAFQRYKTVWTLRKAET